MSHFRRLVLAVLFAAGLLAIQATAASFTSVLPMNTGRYLHTANLMADGKVLVTGGLNLTPGESIEATNGAELYDPSLNTWTLAGSMHVLEYRHTSTLLPDGTVLVVGDVSVDIFDPVSEAWHLTNGPVYSHFHHAATLLSGGRVLITGGTSGAKAEIYHSSTGSWTDAGPMNKGRYGHTATLLPNGKVLVVGGADSQNHPQREAELYNPDTGVWTPINSMFGPRMDHTATLLPNGQVLVVGGSTRVTELYDPNSGAWKLTGFLNVARESGHTATLLPNGKVLVAGGVSVPGGFGANTEIYDPGSGQWKTNTPTTTNRFWHTATRLFDGRILIAAGARAASTADSSTESYGSSNISVEPFRLGIPTTLSNGAIQIDFTNTPDISFVALATTNLSIPQSNWMVVTGLSEILPTHYRLTDPQTTNNPGRFYRIHSP